MEALHIFYAFVFTIRFALSTAISAATLVVNVGTGLRMLSFFYIFTYNTGEHRGALPVFKTKSRQSNGVGSSRV